MLALTAMTCSIEYDGVVMKLVLDKSEGAVAAGQVTGAGAG